MENSYGIGIANRYELFLVDEEAGTPTNKAIKKAKQQKKSTASANVAANGGTNKKKSFFYVFISFKLTKQKLKSNRKKRTNINCELVNN